MSIEQININIKNGYSVNCGSGSPRSKLTEDQVLEIREIYVSTDASYAHLAEHYNVSPALIRRIVIRDMWKHI